MAALVVSRYHPALKNRYQSLIARGKAPKVALVALMRHLIIHLNRLRFKTVAILVADRRQCCQGSGPLQGAFIPIRIQNNSYATAPAGMDLFFANRLVKERRLGQMPKSLVPARRWTFL